MGLKWFRARLRMKKETSKIPEMTGLYYRRVSYAELFASTTRKNEVSDIQAFEPNVSAASIKNESAEYDHSKVDRTSQSSLSSSTHSKESNDTVENAKSSTKDSDANAEASMHDVELNKINKDKSDVSDTKKHISSDNELVI